VLLVTLQGARPVNLPIIITTEIHVLPVNILVSHAAAVLFAFLALQGMLRTMLLRASAAR
jgi:hypothetical protein